MWLTCASVDLSRYTRVLGEYIMAAISRWALLHVASHALFLSTRASFQSLEDRLAVVGFVLQYIVLGEKVK